MTRELCPKCGGRLVLRGLDPISAVAVCRVCHALDQPEIDALVATTKAQADRLANMGGARV